jgi:hypothetical protein
MNDNTIDPDKTDEETLSSEIFHDDVSDEALEAAAGEMSLSLSLPPCRCTFGGVHCR